METGIYQVTNIAEPNKIYVGRCQSTFKHRWDEHIRALDKGKHTNLLLQADWTKYGSEGFTFKVLSACDVITAKYRELDIVDAMRKQGFEMYNVYSMRDDIILELSKYTHNLSDFESEIDLVDVRCKGKKLPLHWQLYVKIGHAEIYIHLYDRSKYVDSGKLDSLETNLITRTKFCSDNGYFEILEDVTDVYQTGELDVFIKTLITQIDFIASIFG